VPPGERALVQTGAITFRARALHSCGSALLLCLLATDPGRAFAQAPIVSPKPPTPTPALQPEATIVVTGSRIPRPNLSATSPITVVDAQEVKLEGAVLTESLLNALPQTYPAQGIFSNSGATGAATVDLRGFGAARTLVLINGRRLLPGDSTDPSPDINFVPSALIKRVEVLTGGASSVYGSDAVSGVVNFIMDTRLSGLRVDGQTSFYQHDNRDGANLRGALDAQGFGFPVGNVADGQIQDINGAVGRSFGGGRGHLTLYAGYRKANAVTQDRRDYSSCTATVMTTDGDIICGGTGTNAAGNFGTRFDPVLKLGQGRSFVPGRAAQFNFAPYNYFQRPDRRYTAGGFADFEIVDAIKPYVELMYMDDRSLAQFAPSADFGNTRQVNCDNPLLSAQQLSVVCFDGNYIGQTPIFDDDGNLVEILGSPKPFTDPVTGATYLKGALRIARRNVEGGPRIEDMRHKDIRAIGGLRGDLGRGVTYDASYLFGRVKQSRVHTNDLSLSRLVRALDVVTDPATGQPACRSFLTGQDKDCVPWDVFVAGGVSAEAAAYLNVPARLDGTVEQKVATAFVTADLGEWGLRSPWAETAPSLNLGLEYRKDTLILQPDEHYQNADITGLGDPLLPFSGSTKVKELFGETRIPIITKRFIEELTVELGYRQSWESNPRHRFTASSSKVALEFAPVRGVRIRASQQRAVRAPNIQELFAPTFQSFFDVDPCVGLNPQATAAQCANTGVTAAQYGHIARNPFEQIDTTYQSIIGGNAELEPETATTRTIGVVLQPRLLPGFAATVDWFDIRLKKAIGAVEPQLVMDTCIATGDPLFCNRIHRDAEGSLWLSPDGFVDGTMINAGTLKTRGIDVQASYSRRFGSIGAFGVQFNGTWTDRFIIDSGGLSTPFNCAGRFGYACGTPQAHWRHNARLTWTARNGASLSLLWRHIGKVTADRLHQDVPSFGFDDPAPSARQVSAREYFDLSAVFPIRDRLSLRFGVRNLLDREPPTLPSGGAGTCSCSGNTWPQLYDPLGRFIFAGFTLNLPRF
jgi:outer membrane receptor protein involved in Fe transport